MNTQNESTENSDKEDKQHTKASTLEATQGNRDQKILVLCVLVYAFVPFPAVPTGVASYSPSLAAQLLLVFAKWLTITKTKQWGSQAQDWRHVQMRISITPRSCSKAETRC